jgi:uncharacterized membrane protein YccC
MRGWASGLASAWPKRKSGGFRWLYAPSPQAFGFALRNTAASFLALGIALWMELDSPVWAVMTVWAVAQNTRGESLSKARWRIVGTFLGAFGAVGIVAAFPQAPWLFFPTVALWVGICSGFATFVSNFRSYALVLAGYTCAIIAMDAASNPDNVFFIAVSRTTYIILGVVCEALMGMIFAQGQEREARREVRRKLLSALSLVSNALADILTQTDGAWREARSLFGTILTINSEIEFSEVEMGPHGHEGDHARAALAAVSILLSRGFGMATRIATLDVSSGVFQTTASHAATLLRSLPARLRRTEEVPGLLASLHALRDECRLRTVWLDDDGLTPLPDDRAPSAIDERAVHVALGEILLDMETAVTEYEASTHHISGDHFHFRLQSHRDPRAAIDNGIRAFAAVLITALFYEVTAWPNGLGFIAITSLVCGLFATRENPVLGTVVFLRGAIWAAIIAGVLALWITPSFSYFESLIPTVGIALFFCGLAKFNPSTAGAAAAFGLLMPDMLAIENHHRINEIAFMNGAMSVVFANVVATLVFRLVLPFDPNAERLRLRRQMLSELRALCHMRIPPRTSSWIGRNIDRFARLIRHAGPKPTRLIEDYLEGTLAVLTIGLNVIRLRTVMGRDHLPASARRAVDLLLIRMERSTGRHVSAAVSAQRTLSRLRALEAAEPDHIVRLELTRALTYVVVIAHALQANSAFLDEKHPFRGNPRTITA